MQRRKSKRANGAHEGLLRRYEAALDRLRLSRGLPNEAALEKIQRATRLTWNAGSTRH